MISTIILLSSGLFLGWSLGANDAANIFGTAVSTKMIRFRTAAIICSIFVILGAVISGSGTSATLSRLGNINQIGGAFTVALSAALTILWMTRTGLPVSTSQAIVGAILGWNIYSSNVINYFSLSKIIGTWVFSPILAAIFSFVLYHIIKWIIENKKIHLIRLDSINRGALILVGAFGAYSLGANNIGNVMGVFINSNNWSALNIAGLFSLSPTQQLFLIGGLAISLGVFTYSRRVMTTVGQSIFKLSPVTALIVVLSSSLVLFLFASEGLQDFLISRNLPAFPLVPVSSSQAIVGAVMGISLAKGVRNLSLYTLGKIALGWVATPLAAGILCYLLLFFVQNVFNQSVF